ncbi:MAG: lysophospholipid transporter LplT [Sporomusaceae bacterium]|nr:lysophospholipid transporter LplT [Sporomusaceae bacterium]
MPICLTPLQALLSMQFLSAFADNMLLFIAQALILRDQYPAYYLSMVQSMYLLSYILASPWVGLYADSVPKARVLLTGNLMKLAAPVLMLLSVNPAAGYLCFGLGSVVYSPGKYGILPVLTTSERELLKANSHLESTTIIAVLGGSLAGGWLSDLSVGIASLTAVAIYCVSLLLNLQIPGNPVKPQVPFTQAGSSFFSDLRFFFSHPAGCFSVLGSAYFWSVTSILRLAIFIWAPLALGLTGNTPVSMLIALIGVGIAIGAFAAPHVVSIATYRRALWFGSAIGMMMILLAFTTSLPLTLLLMLASGVLSGLYIVPVNTLNESVGEASIGAGRGIAVQNFAENSCMLLATGIYSLATWAAVPVTAIIIASGVAFLLLMLHLSRLTRNREVQTGQ